MLSFKLINSSPKNSFLIYIKEKFRSALSGTFFILNIPERKLLKPEEVEKI